mgnify:CR=1 FL=1
MKKFYYAFIALAAVCLASCSSDDDDDKGGNGSSDFRSTRGAYIVNAGNMGGNIPGSMTYIDYANHTATQDVYKTANNRVLGDTPQDAVIYGSKMYIAVYQSNVIEIVNAKTLKSLKTITPSAPGTQPRDLVAKDGFVYVSMYDGYVARIDTITMAIDRTVAVGPNPEEMAIAGNTLYVANSDGLNYQNGYVNGKTVSKIDLGQFKEIKKIEVGLNPTKMVSNGRDVFVITMGDYTAANPATVRRITSNDAVEPVAEATLMAIRGDDLYLINAPYGIDKIAYSLYDIDDKTTSSLVAEGVDSPAAIAIDPVSGDIFISSYNMANGYADYRSPGYVKQYSAAGIALRKYNTGVAPCAILFDAKK